MEWVKKITVRWFSYIERMKDKEFVKKAHLSKTEGANRKGRLLGRWKVRVGEDMHERGTDS